MKRDPAATDKQFSFEFKRESLASANNESNVLRFPKEAVKSPLDRFRTRVLGDLLRTRIPKP